MSKPERKYKVGYMPSHTRNHVGVYVGKIMHPDDYDSCFSDDSLRADMTRCVWRTVTLYPMSDDNAYHYARGAVIALRQQPDCVLALIWDNAPEVQTKPEYRFDVRHCMGAHAVVMDKLIDGEYTERTIAEFDDVQDAIDYADQLRIKDRSELDRFWSLAKQ